MECTAFSSIGLKKALEAFPALNPLLASKNIHTIHLLLYMLYLLTWFSARLVRSSLIDQFLFIQVRVTHSIFQYINNSSLVSALVVLLSCTWAPGSCLGHILLVEVIRRIILPSIRTSAVHRVPTRVRPSWHKSSPFDLSSLRIFNFPQVNARLFHYLWAGCCFVKDSYPGHCSSLGIGQCNAPFCNLLSIAFNLSMEKSLCLLFAPG